MTTDTNKRNPLAPFEPVDPGELRKAWEAWKKEPVREPTLPEVRYPEEIQRAFEEVWPGEDITQLLTEFEAAPELFYQGIQEVGRIPETETLVKAMFPEITELQMQTVFMTEEDWTQFLAPYRKMGPTESTKQLFREMFPGITDEEILQIIPPVPEKIEWWDIGGLIETTRQAVTAGIGDMLVSFGGTLKWLGTKDWQGKFAAAIMGINFTPESTYEERMYQLGEQYTGFGQKLQKEAPVDTLGEWHWTQLFMPQFYAERVARVVPLTVSLIAPALAGFYGTASIPLRIAAWARYVLQVLVGGGISRGLESGAEAGMAFEEAKEAALARGLPLEEAIQEARDISDEVFAKNMYLLGVDVSQFALAFVPVKGTTVLKLMNKGWIKTTETAGRIAIVGLTEAGEEVYQERIQRLAKGETFAWDAEMQLVAAIGGIMGVGFGGFGVAYTNFREQTLKNLPPDLKTQVQQAIDSYEAMGLSEDMAYFRGFDAAMNIDPDATTQATDEAIESIKKTAWAMEITGGPELAAEKEPLIGKKFGFGSAGEFEVIRVEGNVATLRGEAGNEITASVSTLTERLGEEAVTPPIEPVAEVPMEVAPVEVRLRDVWDNTLEYNPLRQGIKETDQGAHLAYNIEAAGDVLRESVGKGYVDPAYIEEKLGRIRISLTDVDWKRPLSEGEQQRFEETKALFERMKEEVPATTKEGKVAIRLIDAVLSRDVNAVRTALGQAEATLLKAPLPKVAPTEVAITEPEAVVEPKVEKAPEVEVEEAPIERLKKLRSTIMAWAKTKGLPETQYRKLFKEYGATTRLTKMGETQLENVLKAIKETRPKTIKGRRVITQKTERKIASLKESLMAEKSLTEKSYQRLLDVLRLKTDKYENARSFITESEAKSLIRAMNDEAPLVAWDVKIEESLAAKPNIKAQWDNIDAKMGKGVEIAGESVKIGRGNELRSMRYYTMLLQKKMDAPIYDIWQKINMAHLAMSQKQQQQIDKLQNSTGDEAFRAIAGDDVALKRIENYIASKHKMGPKKPTDITTQEIKLADEFEQQLFEFRNDVRFARFREAYAGHSGDVGRIAGDIPDAPKDALRRAVDVYEGKGEKGLRAFLDTQDWGIIHSGYNPLAIVKPKLFLRKPKPTTFSKGHIQTREGTEYVQEERNILDRYRSYQKQLMGLTDLAPLIRAMDRVFTESGGKLADPKHVGSVLSRGLSEMKGYHEEGGFLVHMIERLYGQVAATVFWRPDLALRNKFQNWAFNPDFIRGYFAHPQNKFMSPERRLWFEVFVTQNRGIIQDYLLRYHKPLPGFGRITRLANRTSLFPWSDKTNRAEAFMVRMNRVDRALEQYRKDGDVEKLMRDSGLLDLEARQQQEALELLAMDTVEYGVPGMPAVSGEEAFARYNAQQLVMNVHFQYDRAQRSPAEMGAGGRTLGNIMTFQRSWGERISLQTAKAFNPKSKAPMNERILAARIVVGIMVAGWLFGEAYKRITGKRKNPYNPFNILEYSPGGLLYGASEGASNLAYLILESIQGDKAALGKLPGGLTQAAELMLPFYRNLVQVAETATGLKNVDRMALRKVREMIDKEYETRGGQYEVERNLIEILQHVFFGGEAAPESTKDKIKTYERQLGDIDEDWEDLPYTTEEPDINDMRWLNTKFGGLLEVGDEGYTDKGKAFLEKEESEATFKTFPNIALYKIDDFEDYFNQWQDVKAGRATLDDYPKAYMGNFSRRTLDLLRQYHALEGEEQEDFLTEHPELEIDPRDQWLRDNPKQNAQLALWGQAKPMSLEAYDLMGDMARDLDIPDNAIPEFMPRNIFEFDLQYNELELGNARLAFRSAHLDYDEYWVERGRWQPIGDRGKGGGGDGGKFIVPPK